jgi:hypothetical protein
LTSYSCVYSIMILIQCEIIKSIKLSITLNIWLFCDGYALSDIEMYNIHLLDTFITLCLLSTCHHFLDWVPVLLQGYESQYHFALSSRLLALSSKTSFPFTYKWPVFTDEYLFDTTSCLYKVLASSVLLVFESASMPFSSVLLEFIPLDKCYPHNLSQRVFSFGTYSLDTVESQL